MAIEIIMPKISLTMTEGTVVSWRKQEGEAVKKGEVIVEISVDKIVSEEEAPADGILLKILAPENSTLEVGKPIAYIGAAGEVIEAGGAKAPAPAEKTEQAEGASTAGTEDRGNDSKSPEASPLTPAARRAVKEMGLDLSEIEANFRGQKRVTTAEVTDWLNSRKSSSAGISGGAVSAQDGSQSMRDGITAKPAAPKTAPAGKTAAAVRPLAGIRRIIAESMVNSKHSAPHVTMCREIDVSAIVSLRNSANLFHTSIKHTVTDYAIQACAKALTKHREVNTSLTDGNITNWQEINIGIAVAAPNGLMVPVIHNADQISMDEISLRMKELAARVRNNKTTAEDFSGGTFTVSSMGMMGVDMFTPIINQPETAILGLGRIVEKPVVKQGQITVAPMMFLSLSIDHRLIDGAGGAQFLDTVCGYMENPQLM
ncbi:MAG TPA: dihydrolipoamide acetyltransferase family protein [Anaerovoracaceae bacterium]|nr:dihydrolipoamide acetyltransferase family protein [Anaerovoracaceae bacterium]